MQEHSSIPESLTTRELVRELVDDTQLLLKRQVALAQLEGRQQLRRELQSARVLGVAAAIGYAGVIVLLVAAALGIGAAIGADWAGALVVGCALVVLGVAGAVVGWTKRVKQPLPRTRGEVTKELTWLRQQVTT